MHSQHTFVFPILLGEFLVQPHVYPKTKHGLAGLGVVGLSYFSWYVGGHTHTHMTKNLLGLNLTSYDYEDEDDYDDVTRFPKSFKTVFLDCKLIGLGKPQRAVTSSKYCK